MENTTLENTNTQEVKPNENNKPSMDDVSGEYNGNQQVNDPSTFKPIKYFYDGLNTFDEDIEKRRKTYAGKISKSKKYDIISIFAMLIAFGGVIITYFLDTTSVPWVNWLVIGIAAVIIIGSFIFANTFNKKNATIANDYLAEYEDATNSYYMSSLNVENAQICIDAKVNDQKVIETHYFKVINSINSRAVVEAKRKGRDFSIAEVAVVIPPVTIEAANKKPESYLGLNGSEYIPTKEEKETLKNATVEISQDVTLIDVNVANNKNTKNNDKNNNREPVDNQMGLFGKLFSYDMKVMDYESLIICFMGEKKYTVLPDYLNGFHPIFVPGLRSNIVIYATNPIFSAKFLEEDGLKIINDIYTSAIIQSAFISINSHGTNLGITLADDVMSLPLKQSATIGCFDQVKETVDKAFKFIDLVDEKRNKD